jgi:hypothetical protein
MQTASRKSLGLRVEFHFGKEFVTSKSIVLRALALFAGLTLMTVSWAAGTFENVYVQEPAINRGYGNNVFIKLSGRAWSFAHMGLDR